MTRIDQVPPPDVPDGESATYGSGDDIGIRFDPTIGANGAYVIKDRQNNQDRFELRVGDVLRLLAQNLDVNGVDIEDAGTTIYDAASGEIENAVVDGLSNFADGDVFSGYPIGLGGDTDTDLSGTDLSDGATTIYDAASGEIENAVVDALTNLADGTKFSAYPLQSADIGTDQVGGSEINLSDIAGTNLTVDGANHNLDAGGGGASHNLETGSFNASGQNESTTTVTLGTAYTYAVGSAWVDSWPADEKGSPDSKADVTGYDGNGGLDVTWWIGSNQTHTVEWIALGVST